ncbi:16866_t:CDS:2, partial [Acaulospora morrowiae]
MIENASLIKQGAEARVYTAPFLTRKAIVKERFRKTYRHPALDKKLTARRVTQVQIFSQPPDSTIFILFASTNSLFVYSDEFLFFYMEKEARSLFKCHKSGVDTPILYFVDVENSTIYMEFVEGK